MDLTALLLRAGARRPHVLVAAAVGGTGVRLAVEAALARRGWPAAGGPADADILVVAGVPGPELAPVVERIWRQIPAPRARASIACPSRTDATLDAAAAQLALLGHQRIVARVTDRPPDHGGDEHEAPGDDEHGDDERGDEQGTDEGGDGEHDGHAGMEMPGGRPMAEMAEDRDGLMLDRLHLPLGPVLLDWPAGLVLRLTLQGDVVQEAEAAVLDAGRGAPFWDRQGHARVRELDALARFLGVAGWADAAARARRIRDAALAGADVADPVAVLVRRVRRSRTLRRLVTGIAAGPVDVAGWLERRLAAVDAPGVGSSRAAVGDLPELLAGAELAAARLVVAALDPDTEPAGTAGALTIEVPRGEATSGEVPSGEMPGGEVSGG